MRYALFIDDERYPPLTDGPKWIIARSVNEAKRIISHYGWPSVVSFDHDLGDNEPSGKDFANWLIECDLDSRVLPPDFKFVVHSMNPVGAENIQSLMGQYLTYRAQNENPQ